jgi:hypothetical protein
MGTVVTVTIGTRTYSVYANATDAVSDANDYMAARLGSTAWDNASVSDKKRALVMATRWLDRQQWAGVPTDVDTPQPLQHPRTGLTDCNGTAVASTVVAPGIPEAEYELALDILGDNEADKSQGEGSNLRRAKAGTAEVEFFQNTIGSSRDHKLPQVAHDLVKCYFGGSSVANPTVYGNDEETAFDEEGQTRSMGFA